MKIPLKICVLFLVVALLAAPTVSTKKITEYTVRPSIENASEITPSVTDSISQGETNIHSFSVEYRVDWLELHHKWQNSYGYTA